MEELRADRTAPLDSDGGEALPERHHGEKVYRYQVLCALMLSSQTKDAVVGDAMRKLQSYGLTVERIRDIDVDELKGLIGKVGFYNNKSKYMKQTAEMLINDYDGDIPPTANEMMKLPGVGPKMVCHLKYEFSSFVCTHFHFVVLMIKQQKFIFYFIVAVVFFFLSRKAFIIESIAFNKSTGIGVDTHMHRIFNDLKWVKSKTPEQTREQLEGKRDKNCIVHY